MEIQKQPVLVGPYWFALYTQFFAIISLVFYVLENPDKPGATEVLTDARAGSEVVAGLAHRSLAADRISQALRVSAKTTTHPNAPQLTCPSHSLNNSRNVSGRLKAVRYHPRSDQHQLRNPAMLRFGLER
jgi:hypothetical protein